MKIAADVIASRTVVQTTTTDATTRDRVLNLVDLLISVVTRNRSKAGAVGSVRQPVVRTQTSVHSGTIQAMIVPDSFRLTAAIVVASLHHIAAVTTVDAATSVRRSVGRVTTVVAWVPRRAIIAAALIVVPATLSRHTATPIVGAVISVLHSMDRAVIVATMDHHPETPVTNAVATAKVVVLNHRCETHSEASPRGKLAEYLHAKNGPCPHRGPDEG